MRETFSELPRGRHQLTREQVRESQRGRLLFGIADAVAEHGYAKTTVADVLKRVHVSRETFYQHFTDKQDCFVAALDQCGEALAVVIEHGLGDVESASPLHRFDRALAVYLDTLAAAPSLAKAFFLEATSAGPEAQRSRYAVQDRFVTAVADNFAESWRELPDPRFAARALVGAISTIVAATLVSDGAEALAGLHRQVMALLEHLHPA